MEPQQVQNDRAILHSGPEKSVSNAAFVPQEDSTRVTDSAPLQLQRKMKKFQSGSKIRSIVEEIGGVPAPPTTIATKRRPDPIIIRPFSDRALDESTTSSAEKEMGPSVSEPPTETGRRDNASRLRRGVTTVRRMASTTPRVRDFFQPASDSDNQKWNLAASKKHDVVFSAAGNVHETGENQSSGNRMKIEQSIPDGPPIFSFSSLPNQRQQPPDSNRRMKDNQSAGFMQPPDYESLTCHDSRNSTEQNCSHRKAGQEASGIFYRRDVHRNNDDTGRELAADKKRKQHLPSKATAASTKRRRRSVKLAPSSSVAAAQAQRSNAAPSATNRSSQISNGRSMVCSEWGVFDIDANSQSLERHEAMRVESLPSGTTLVPSERSLCIDDGSLEPIFNHRSDMAAGVNESTQEQIQPLLANQTFHLDGVAQHSTLMRSQANSTLSRISQDEAISLRLVSAMRTCSPWLPVDDSMPSCLSGGDGMEVASHSAQVNLDREQDMDRVVAFATSAQSTDELQQPSVLGRESTCSPTELLTLVPSRQLLAPQCELNPLFWDSSSGNGLSPENSFQWLNHGAAESPTGSSLFPATDCEQQKAGAADFEGLASANESGCQATAAELTEEHISSFAPDASGNNVQSPTQVLEPANEQSNGGMDKKLERSSDHERYRSLAKRLLCRPTAVDHSEAYDLETAVPNFNDCYNNTSESMEGVDLVEWLSRRPSARRLSLNKRNAQEIAVSRKSQGKRKMRRSLKLSESLDLQVTEHVRMNNPLKSEEQDVVSLDVGNLGRSPNSDRLEYEAQPSKRGKRNSFMFPNARIVEDVPNKCRNGAPKHETLKSRSRDVNSAVLDVDDAPFRNDSSEAGSKRRSEVAILDVRDTELRFESSEFQAPLGKEPASSGGIDDLQIEDESSDTHTKQNNEADPPTGAANNVLSGDGEQTKHMPYCTIQHGSKVEMYTCVMDSRVGGAEPALFLVNGRDTSEVALHTDEIEETLQGGRSSNNGARSKADCPQAAEGEIGNDCPVVHGCNDIGWANENHYLKGMAAHSGNKLFLATCNARRAEYIGASTEGRNVVVAEMLQSQTFWKPDVNRDMWVLESQKAADDRIRKSLNDRRRLRPETGLLSPATDPFKGSTKKRRSVGSSRRRSTGHIRSIDALANQRRERTEEKGSSSHHMECSERGNALSIEGKDNASNVNLALDGPSGSRGNQIGNLDDIPPVNFTSIDQTDCSKLISSPPCCSETSESIDTWKPLHVEGIGTDWATEYDYLKGVPQHVGNLYFNGLLNRVRTEYFAGGKVIRDKITKMIMERIISWRRVDTGWCQETSDMVKDRLYKNLSDKRLLHRATAMNEEEQGWLEREENAPEKQEKILEPLPGPPIPIDHLPTDSEAKWTYDERSRCLFCDFRSVDVVSTKDKCFLAQLLERDDVTVITEGLINIDRSEWTLDRIETVLGDKIYHKIRKFMRHNDRWVEVDGSLSMRVADFIRYLELFSEAEKVNQPLEFHYVDSQGAAHTFEDVRVVALYMIDIDMAKFLHELDEDYKSGFKIKEMLPGGDWCMMNQVPVSARPFMGPNMYISVGGGFTQLHQDGFGTVDSGHSCLAGFNEVIMLRRLPEEHKVYASRLLQDAGTSSNMRFSPLYCLPHDDHKVNRPAWASQEVVNEWERMGYCPSVFILRPGQHVHINKGRLHAFRKLRCEELPENDCHATLRQDLIRETTMKATPICVSVAFDWTYLGFTSKGIENETMASLESALLCQKRKSKSLAIPETSILMMANRLNTNTNTANDERVVAIDGNSIRRRCVPSILDVCRGILPALARISNSTSTKDRSNAEKRPDAHENLASSSIDPYGDDYFCIVCHRELANEYFHCLGCENLLSKDFNICALCLDAKEYYGFQQMHPINSTHKSDVNHIGNVVRSNNSAHNCGQDICPVCTQCTRCACNCHTRLERHFRFFSSAKVQDIVKKIAAVAEMANGQSVAELANGEKSEPGSHPV